MNSAPQKITIFVPFFPPIVGGMERQAWVLAKIFQDGGYDVLVVTTHAQEAFAPRYEYGGIQVAHHRATEGLIGWVRQLMHVALRAWERRRSVAFLTIQPKPNYILIDSIARIFSIRRLALFVSSGQTANTGDEITILRSFFLGFPAERCLKKGTMAMVSSEGMAAQLEEYGFDRQKMRIVRIPVETGNKAIPVRNPPTVYWYLGRLEENKGLHILIESWKRFMDESSCPKTDKKLVLIGRAVHPYWSELMRKERDLGAYGIVVAGEVQSPWETLDPPDVLVHPTLLEGMSSTLLEAMSRGVPIVTTAIPVNVDLMQKGQFASLVEPGSVEAFHRGLIDLHRDFGVALDRARAARSYIESEHAFSVVLEKWRSVIEGR